MEVLLAHPGTQYSHQLARQLFSHGSLYEFWTGFALAKDTWRTQILDKYLPEAWHRRIANRMIANLPGKHLRTMPLLELEALRRLRNGSSPQSVFHKRNRRFQERIPTSSIENASVVIGFDTSSWVIAAKALKFGKPFCLDQSIAHPLTNQSTSEVVADSFPNWATTIERRLPEVLACENCEHDLATKIVVASSFTKQSLIFHGVSGGKIVVNPYGVDLTLFHPPEEPRARKPLRFLFLGSISARKGVPLLIEAWRNLELQNAELWLAGPIGDAERKLIPNLAGLNVLGKLPFEALPDLLRLCDVLVFPSYCEGFALVLLEALASGMPIITTEATAGPDLIDDKREGILIPSGSLDALQEAINYLVENAEELEQMSVAARKCAEKFSWDSYGDRWERILQEFV